MDNVTLKDALRASYANCTTGGRMPSLVVTSGAALNVALCVSTYQSGRMYRVTPDGIALMEEEDHGPPA